MWPAVTDILWSVCVPVCLLDILPRPAKLLNQLRYCFGCGFVGPREPCIRWGPISPINTGRGIFREYTWAVACLCLPVVYIYSTYSALFIRQHNVSAAVSILYFTCLYRDCLASWLQKNNKILLYFRGSSSAASCCPYSINLFIVLH